MIKAVAVLETMWDWRAKTSRAGYAETAPPYFRINPENFTGRRLYDWLGHDNLLVTNACPQLANSADEHGKPDPEWLANNLHDLSPIGLTLVCGNVAQRTFDRAMSDPKLCGRVVYCPHPAARMWTRRALDRCRYVVQSGRASVRLRVRRGRLVVTPLSR